MTIRELKRGEVSCLEDFMYDWISAPMIKRLQME